MTENHPAFSFREEGKRLEYFYKRHGRKVSFQRSGRYYKLHHLEKKYCHVITLSDTFSLLSQYPKPYNIFPSGIINQRFKFNAKNHLAARKNFLWLGSTGAIHKGLDILIDVFRQRDDIILHICGLNKYEKKLLSIPKTKNIIEYGYIDISSDIFLELMNYCSFIILPSCSEGFSTAITTGMLHGLIPIVMKDAGFNRLGSYAIFLENYTTEYVNEKLTEMANETPERLNELNIQVFQFARESFVISKFGADFKNIISEILSREN